MAFNIAPLRFGFEAECLFKADMLSALNATPSDVLAKYLGPTARIADFLGQGTHSQISYRNWNLVDDSTIDADPGFIPAEIISPTFEYPSFSKHLGETFSCIRAYGKTTESCGFHVGISLEGIDLEEKLDVLKMVVFLGESMIAKMFERFDNQYAQLLAPFVSKYLGSFHDIEDHIYDLVQRPLFPVSLNVDSIIPWDKYFSVNFTKIRSNNYIEFRLMGGEGYHMRESDVLAVAKRVGWAVSIACDPNAHVQEYTQKLLAIAKAAPRHNYTAADNIKLAPTTDGYLVSLQDQSGKLSVSFDSVRTQDGAVLHGCSTDHIGGKDWDAVYHLLVSGVGGVKFSIASKPKRELIWALESFLDRQLPKESLLYLVTACPTLFYVYAQSQLKVFSLVRAALTDHTSRAALRRALAKCDTYVVASLYESLRLFPTHVEPNIIVNALNASGADFEEFSVDYLAQGVVGPLDVAEEAFFYIDAASYKYRDIGRILNLMFSTQDAARRLPMEHTESLAQLVLEQCHADFNLEYARDNFLSNLTDSMNKLSTKDMPFLDSLLSIGLAYENNYVVGLARALAGRNVDKSWSTCLGSV
jgi:hypothetical protein